MALIDAAYCDTEEEFAKILSFLSETYGSFHFLRNWSLTRMGEWKYGGNDRIDGAGPGSLSRNLHIWSEGSKVLGLAVSERGEDMTLQVGPDQRALEERMLDWTENEWGRDMDRIVVPVFANDVWRQNILKRRGYRPTGSHCSLRRYDTMISPHETPLEHGFSLSDLERSKDAGGYTEVLAKAFRKSSFDKKWFESKRKAPGYRTSMVLQVLSPDGKCVSCAEARVDWKQNYAEIALIATHPDYQNRGLAKACLAQCFGRLADMKVRDAYIRSKGEHAPSDRWYDSMLPIEKVEEFSWELTR